MRSARDRRKARPSRPPLPAPRESRPSARMTGQRAVPRRAACPVVAPSAPAAAPAPVGASRRRPPPHRRATAGTAGVGGAVGAGAIRSGAGSAGIIDTRRVARACSVGQSSSRSRNETFTPNCFGIAPLAWVRNSESRPSSRNVAAGSSAAASMPESSENRVCRRRIIGALRSAAGCGAVDSGMASSSGADSGDAVGVRSGRDSAVAAAGATQRRRRSNG